MRPGTFLLQEEPRVHCTSVRSDNGSNNFMMVPNSRQHASPDHHWPTTKPVMQDNVASCIMFTTASPDFHNLHGLSVNRVPMADLLNLLRMPIKLHSAGLWSQVLENIKPSCQVTLIRNIYTRSQLEIILSGFSSAAPVPPCTRYWSCCWFNALLQPCSALFMWQTQPHNTSSDRDRTSKTIAIAFLGVVLLLPVKLIHLNLNHFCLDRLISLKFNWLDVSEIFFSSVYVYHTQQGPLPCQKQNSNFLKY